ncbi:methyltransferase [Spirillospora sp. NPDC127200]
MSPTPELIIDTLNGVHLSAALRAGIALRVFDPLAAGPLSAADVAAKTGADARATRILLDVLAAGGFLDRTGDAYRLAPVAETYLITGTPAYIGGLARVLASDIGWEGGRRLAEAVRAGGSVIDDHAELPDHPFWEVYATSMEGLAEAGPIVLQSVLEPWLKEQDELRVLDVACGNGGYGQLLATAVPHAAVTSLDWPGVIPVARATAERLGVADRVSYIEGDMFEVPFGGPYDLVLCSNVFHHFGEARCAELLARATGALRPGGRIVVHDFMPPENGPLGSASEHIFSLEMLAVTRKGEAHPVSTYRRLLDAAGYGPAELHEPGLPTKILVADRRR